MYSPGARAPVDPGSPARPDDLEELEFQRLVGRWNSPEPAEVARLLRGSGVRWWIAGGWALEAAGAVSRPHKDTDVAFAAQDLPLLRRHAQAVGWDVWAPGPDGYRPILAGNAVGDDQEQFWVRSGATGPWLLDLLATPIDGADWVFKKDARIRRPIDSLAQPGDVPSLVAEVVLLHQAVQADVASEPQAAHLRLLDSQAMAWLLAALALHDPDHPWIDAMGPSEQA